MYLRFVSYIFYRPLFSASYRCSFGLSDQEIRYSGDKYLDHVALSQRDDLVAEVLTRTRSRFWSKEAARKGRWVIQPHAYRHAEQQDAGEGDPRADGRQPPAGAPAGRLFPSFFRLLQCKTPFSPCAKEAGNGA